jgi:predicted esterase
MQTHSLRAARTARFHTLGEAARAREIWFLLHGYGQLANAMIEACSVLAAPDRLLVAPEALSRFYLRGGNGPVGATWMTREDRDNEIADYVAYLDLVARRIDELGAHAAGRRNVLGFSQGAVTACRWACNGAMRFDSIVLWGGGVPPAASGETLRQRLSSARIVLVRGDGDAVHDGAAVERDFERLRAAGATVRREIFSGGHALDASTLARIALAE